MLTLAHILFILVALLLIGVVLIQQPKTSGGLFAGTGQSLLGTSGKTFWTKFTTILAAVFMGLCLLIVWLSKNSTNTSPISESIAKQQQQIPAQPAVPATVTGQAAPKVQANPAPQGVPAAPGSPAKPVAGQK
jgi:preprotein translocase subunit SecG